MTPDVARLLETQCAFTGVVDPLLKHAPCATIASEVRVSFCKHLEVLRMSTSTEPPGSPSVQYFEDLVRKYNQYVDSLATRYGSKAPHFNIATKPGPIR